MRFFSKIFDSDNTDEPQPHIQLGRFTDSYKSAEQYDAWDLASNQFEEQNYLAYYHSFFNYLLDKETQNVIWREENGKIYFEIFQGSKKIEGIADEKNFKAIAIISKAKSLNIGFMRRLVEYNFELRYSHFALSDINEIVIIYSSATVDNSPYKMYYALKELAIKADKQDDLLLDEFPEIEPVQNQHITELSENEKIVKYDFLQEKIKSVFEIMDSGRLNPAQYPGAMAYLMLDLNYRLDFLISPEGFMTDMFERVHRQYFENDGNPTAAKNLQIRKEFQKLLTRTKAENFKEMYRTKSTFGITSPVNLDKIISFIDGELGNMDWYAENNHEEVALAIPGYIVGYCLFNYANPKPIFDLFKLYYQIIESEYFDALGFAQNYRMKNLPSGKNLNNKTIKHALKKIENRYKTEFNQLKIDAKKVDLTSVVTFSKSFLLMIRDLDLNKT